VIETEPVVTDPLARLEEDGLSILITQSGRPVYRSYRAGVRPLIEIAAWFPSGLPGAVVADRVVGGCAALVFAGLRAKRVLALVGSFAAERILHEHAIAFEPRLTVTEVQNRDGSGPCPFELLSRGHQDARTLIPALQAQLAELAQSRR
jgi:hypothetical protein